MALWLLDRALRAVLRKGTLAVRLPDGEIRRYGRGTPHSAIAIHDWPTLRRIALDPDLALGEAWMDGMLTVERGDLYGFLALCLSNMGQGPGPWPRRVHQRLRMAVRRLLMHNPVGRAQRNAAHHYDLGDDLYDLFLDSERQYSCAYFETPGDSLETAQAQKMRHIAAKLRLPPGQKVLDIGSGWGGLGMYLARAAKLAALLKDDGVAMIHTIGSVGEPAAPHPWIAKYIFPGGYIPALSEIAPAVERAGLVVTDLEVLRLHYAETLKAWRTRFMARRDEAAALYDERFCRMWEFYLAACEAGFRHNGLVVFQIQLAPRLDSLPVTRGYIETGERTLPDPSLAPAKSCAKQPRDTSRIEPDAVE